MGSDSKTNGSGGGGGTGSGGQIPASMKKVVQNLKEIVSNNCTDLEIYAILRDCNMDPNDAVQRLLSQDTFREVKSRRDRRKEMKETQELKTRVNNGTSNRCVRGGGEHSFERSSSIQIISNELGKAAYRKENGSVASIPHSASSTLRATCQTWNEQPSSQSNCYNADNRRQSIRMGGSQSTWVDTTFGPVSMADIVRMGRPQSKGSQMPSETYYTRLDAVPPNSAIYQRKPSLVTSPSQSGQLQDLHSSNLNMTRECGKRSSQYDFDNEGHVNGPITASSDIGATMYSNQSNFHSNRIGLSSSCWSDNILVSGSSACRGNIRSNHVSSDQASNKQILINNSEGTSEHDDDLCKDANAPDSHQQIYESPEGIGRGSNLSVPNTTGSLSDDAIKAVSSVSLNLQQLSFGEQQAVTPAEDNNRVVLPDYFQAFSAGCSHLSFGTYKSGKSTTLPLPQASSSLTNNSEEMLTTQNGCPSSTHLNSGDSVYGNEGQLEFFSDTHRETADYRNYIPPKFSQGELRKIDIPDAAELGKDYVSSLSIPGSSFKNIQQSFVIDPIVRNLPFPSEVQSYSNSIPTNLLAATIQSIKARDSAAFLASESISSRYSGSESSFKNLTASMSEVLNSGAFSVSHPSSQALLGANSATGPVLREHLSALSYSQTGYPAIPQGHAYVPSALQQAYPDGNVFLESYTGIKYNVPPYRNANMSSLLSSGSCTAYQSSGNSAGFPGSFLHDQSAGPVCSKVGYDDFLRARYGNGGDDLNQLQQNDGSATWASGHGSRTISTIPGGPNHNLRGQSHQFAAYQQGQRHPKLQGALGYPGIYNSQAGISIEQQQQNRLDMLLNGSQDPSTKHLPQIWQPSY
ncbi:hypothetical protein PTKIN_Ptkin08bG0072900 [Pterospermum kingtungense]